MQICWVETKLNLYTKPKQVQVIFFILDQQAEQD